MESLTQMVGENAVPVEFDCDFVLELDDKTYKGLQKIFNRLAFIECVLGKNYDLDRLRELVQADRDGRLAILSEPMKPMIYYPGSNDTDVYCPNCGETLSGLWDFSDADYIKTLCQCPKCGQSIGDTKCEQAEAALNEMKEDESE